MPDPFVANDPADRRQGSPRFQTLGTALLRIFLLNPLNRSARIRSEAR